MFESTPSPFAAIIDDANVVEDSVTTLSPKPPGLSIDLSVDAGVETGGCLDGQEKLTNL